MIAFPLHQGQFACGALRCQERKDLHSYELNFKYKEAGEIKNELVKVRGCLDTDYPTLCSSYEEGSESVIRKDLHLART